MVPGTAKNPPILRRMRPTPTMNSFRRPAFVLVPLALAAALLAYAGSVAAQSAAQPPVQTDEEADKAKADAEKRRQADEAARAEAARKAEARKPKRDQNGDRKDPERELEEEEDI
jgi:Na+-transporting methylmalonyl-CoA/oxaloacetate decarboxylase gamma subunit